MPGGGGSSLAERRRLRGGIFFIGGDFLILRGKNFVLFGLVVTCFSGSSFSAGFLFLRESDFPMKHVRGPLIEFLYGKDCN